MARGSLKQRYKGSWSIVLDLGYQIDPQTGKKKRKQRWYTVRGAKRDAEARLTELLNQANHNILIEPTKLTLGDWLDSWVEVAMKPPFKRLRTYESYKLIIRRHLKPMLGDIRLQELGTEHLERYYSEKSQKLSQSTLRLHHAIISAALKSAVAKNVLPKNVAPLVANRPKPASSTAGDAHRHCWDEIQARSFLSAAKAFGPQAAALYAVALDSGARKGELCGLRWPNVDLESRTIRLAEQLIKPGQKPIFGPLKNGTERRIELSPQTVALLHKHRAHQAELKLGNRTYHDLGLVFAKEWNDLTRPGDRLGETLAMQNIGQRQFADIIKAAGVTWIKFHGMRHTCATLLLKAGIPVHVVSE